MSIPIFVINLDRDAARMQRIGARLAALGLSFERFSASLGAALSAEERKRFAPHDDYWLQRRPFQPGEIGCTLSHWRLIEAIRARGLPHALILEDDVDFAPDFADVVAALPDLLRRFDLVKLEGMAWQGRYAQRRIGALGARDLLLPRYPAVGAAAYAINARAAEKLGAVIVPIVEPVDHTITDYALHDLRFAEIFPHPAWQEEGVTANARERLEAAKTKPTPLWRLRRRGHKIARAVRQRLYEVRRLGLWTLWTTPDMTTRPPRASRERKANAHALDQS